MGGREKLSKRRKLWPKWVSPGNVGAAQQDCASAEDCSESSVHVGIVAFPAGSLCVSVQMLSQCNISHKSGVSKGQKVVLETPSQSPWM